MAYCRYCAKEIHETAKRCPHCGAEQGADAGKNKGTVALAIISLILGILAFLVSFSLKEQSNVEFSIMLSVACGAVGFLLGLLSLWKHYPAMGVSISGVVISFFALLTCFAAWHDLQKPLDQRVMFVKANQQTQPPQPAPAVAVTINSPPAQPPQQSQDSNWAPSYDCSKVRSGPERLICSNKQLSEVDVRLSRAYAEFLNKTPDRQTAKMEQISWLKNVRDACSTTECMLNAYSIRIAELTR